jgi:plastocyanin
MKRIALLLLSLLILAACRGETAEEKKTTWLGTPEPGATTAENTDTATGTHPASPGGTALVPGVTSGTTVLVMLNDNSIAMPQQAIPPGPAVLTVENRGSDVHNLFIEGPGVNRAAGDAIPEGRSATVDVTFAPGTYTFYCPIGDHRTTNGEQVQVTIAAP